MATADAPRCQADDDLARDKFHDLHMNSSRAEVDQLELRIEEKLLLSAGSRCREVKAQKPCNCMCTDVCMCLCMRIHIRIHMNLCVCTNSEFRCEAKERFGLPGGDCPSQAFFAALATLRVCLRSDVGKGLDMITHSLVQNAKSHRRQDIIHIGLSHEEDNTFSCPGAGTRNLLAG